MYSVISTKYIAFLLSFPQKRQFLQIRFQGYEHRQDQGGSEAVFPEERCLTGSPWWVFEGNALKNYLLNSSMPFLILRMDSSLPRISASSIAPPGDVGSPDRAVLTGHSS